MKKRIIDYDKVYQLARAGAKNKDICDGLQLAESFFYDLLKKDEKFAEAYKKGKSEREQEAFARAEESLQEMAYGYYRKISEPVKLKTVRRDGQKVIEDEKIEMVERTVYYPPNVTALIFFLANLKNDKYRRQDRVERDEKGKPIGTTINLVREKPKKKFNDETGEWDDD